MTRLIFGTSLLAVRYIYMPCACATISLALIALLAFPQVGIAAGGLDPSFGQGGVARGSFGDGAVALGIAPGRSGRTLAAGEDSRRRFAVLRSQPAAVTQRASLVQFPAVSPSRQ